MTESSLLLGGVASKRLPRDMGERKSVNQRMTCIDAGICLINKRGEHYKGHVEYDLASIIMVKWRGEHRHGEDNDDDE